MHNIISLLCFVCTIPWSSQMAKAPLFIIVVEQTKRDVYLELACDDNFDLCLICHVPLSMV